MVPVLVDRTLLRWAHAVAKNSIPDLTSKALLWKAETFAELVIPVVPWGAHLHPLAFAFAVLRIPVLICRTWLIVLALALAGLLVPLLVVSADIDLGAHAVTCLEAKHVGGYAHDLLFAHAFAKD